MTVPTTEQIAGWITLGGIFFGLWKAYVVWVKERSFGKTLGRELKAKIEALEKKCKDYDELKEDFDYLEDKFDKLRDRFLDKISL